MDVKKMKIGIAVDKDVVGKLDEIATTSTYLGTSRSEIINVILRAFFKSDINHTEKTRDLIIRYRKELL